MQRLSPSDSYVDPLPQSDYRGIRIPLIDVFLVVGFFVFSCDVIDKFLRPSGIDNLVYFGIYSATILLLLLSGYLPAILTRAPLLLLLIAMPLISAWWSIDSRMTILRSVELVGSSLFGLFAGWHLSSHALLQRLAIGFGLMVVGSLLVIFLLPAQGIGQDEAWRGTWVGLSLHKNGLGGTTSLAVLVLTYALIVVERRWLVTIALVLALVLLVGSKSATSQLVTIIGLALGACLLIFQLNPRLGAFLGVLSLILIPAATWAFIANDIGPMLVSMIGKDTTLGSRMGIWDLVWPYIQDRWWLGYGYGAFWQPDLPWVDQVAARLNFTPYYSHNGVVELWLGGGITLVSLTGIVYLISLIKSVLPVISDRHAWHQAFALVFMLTFILRNMTEATALTRNDISWILFVAATAALARDVVIRFTPSAR